MNNESAAARGRCGSLYDSNEQKTEKREVGEDPDPHRNTTTTRRRKENDRDFLPRGSDVNFRQALYESSVA